MLLLDDKEILKLHRKGGASSQKAFNAIVAQYAEQLYWQIRRQTKNHEDTNDVLQNTLLKVYKALDKFEGKSALTTWMYSIARNETYTFLEKRNKQVKQEYDDASLELLTIPGDLGGLPPEQIEALLFRALDTLPDKQAQVFQLKYFENMSFKSISQQLGTSVGGLKASYHHAVKKIEENLKNALNLL
ncbi:sigma-70 family RNA polymerase sigma factor [Lishizhenia sp.]|uniref:RNA polymerase sigma factor n=1 Tax=Lishizhenia sp. TaxID=2497594 RepID=UPI00299E63A5|nr:sigma-70 family RNA polymerase sigma factor [Lishizhenia sp.]MDX1447162.1 sigma-70 family RNA polymerase sigma factor [Lishizhenia sp.]